MIILNSPLFGNELPEMEWGFGQIMAIGMLIAFYAAIIPEVIGEF